MKTYKQLQNEYMKGLIDLDDRFFEYEEIKKMDLQAIIFVKHIEEHLNEMGLNEDQVMCKICNKLIGEIYEEHKQSKQKQQE